MADMKKFTATILGVALLVGGAYGGWYLYKNKSKSVSNITAKQGLEETRINEKWGNFSLPSGWHITSDKQCSHSVTSSISQSEMIATYDISPDNSRLMVSICVADRHGAKNAADWYETYEDSHPEPDSTHIISTEQQGEKEVYSYRDDRSKEDTMQYIDLHYVVLSGNKVAYITARSFEVVSSQSSTSTDTTMTTKDYRSYEPQIKQIVNSVTFTGE